MKLGKLYTVKSKRSRHRFCKVEDRVIQNVQTWSRRPLVSYGDILLCTDECLNISKSVTFQQKISDLTCIVGLAHATLAGMHHAMDSAPVGLTILGVEEFNQTKKQYQKTGKIFGAVFLTPTCQTIWISRYDQKQVFKIR